MPVLVVNHVAGTLQPLGFLNPSMADRTTKLESSDIASSWVTRTNCGISEGGRPPGLVREGHWQLPILHAFGSQLYPTGPKAAIVCAERNMETMTAASQQGRGLMMSCSGNVGFRKQPILVIVDPQVLRCDFHPFSIYLTYLRLFHLGSTRSATR